LASFGKLGELNGFLQHVHWLEKSHKDVSEDDISKLQETLNKNINCIVRACAVTALKVFRRMIISIVPMDFVE
jgi:hypothetical protein